jgi:hypothetical protein
VKQIMREEIMIRSMHMFKFQMASAGAWLGEDPRRTSVAIAALVAVATAVAVVVGLQPVELLFAGPLPGGGGGSC